jgi:hypothetical protein
MTTDEGRSEPVPPSPTVSSPPTHPLDRRNARLLAIIAVVGVVVGGVIAAGSSYLTAKVTAGSQRDIALEEYRRQRRQDSYSALLDSVLILEKKELFSAMTAVFTNPKDYDAELAGAPPRRQAWQDAFKDFESKIPTIQLVGSPRIIALVHDLDTVHLGISQVRDVGMPQSVDPVTHKSTTPELHFEHKLESADIYYSNQLDELALDLRRHYTDAARTDLGLSG